MSGEGKSKTWREKGTEWLIGGVGVAVLAGVIVVVIEHRLYPPEPPKPFPVLQKTRTPADVTIGSVDFRRSSHRGFLWKVIPYPKEYMGVFKVRFENRLGTPIENCVLGYEYGNGGTTLSSVSNTYVGRPFEWFGGKPSYVTFALSADRMSEVEFFSEPRKPDIPKPEWLRVRAYNEKGFATPWYDVDLSKVSWEPDLI